MRLDPDARLPSSGDQNSLKVRLSDLHRQVAIAVNRILLQKYGDIEAGNYLQISDSGILTLNGSATVFDDLLGQLIGQKLESPSSAIVQNSAEGSVTFKTTSGLSDYVVTLPQMRHSWKIGSVVYPHIHWWQTSSSIPNWMIQYRWQDQGTAKTTAWTSVKYDSHAFTYTSGTLNQITGFPDITPPVGAGLSDILQFRIIRDNANASGLFSGADPVATDIDAVSFDCHIEIDSLGSDEEYVK